MWLSKNEKKVLKLLLDDAKLSDTAIAGHLGISSQAIGRLRKELEEKVIKNYTLNLDYEWLGLNVFTIARASIKKDYEMGDKKELRECLNKEPQVISAYELLGGEHSHLLMGAFRDISELRNFCCEKNKHPLHKFLSFKEIHTIPTCNIIKNDFNSLMHKSIDEFGTKQTEPFLAQEH